MVVFKIIVKNIRKNTKIVILFCEHDQVILTSVIIIFDNRLIYRLILINLMK